MQCRPRGRGWLRRSRLRSSNTAESTQAARRCLRNRPGRSSRHPRSTCSQLHTWCSWAGLRTARKCLQRRANKQKSLGPTSCPLGTPCTSSLPGRRNRCQRSRADIHSAPCRPGRNPRRMRYRRPAARCLRTSQQGRVGEQWNPAGRRSQLDSLTGRPQRCCSQKHMCPLHMGCRLQRLQLKMSRAGKEAVRKRQCCSLRLAEGKSIPKGKMCS